MFESMISARVTEKLSETKPTGKLDAETISSCSYDMEGHAKRCVERHCEFANKTTEQLYKAATPCILARIGRPDILWSANELARADQITDATAYVLSDSVLCVGKLRDDPIATWKSKIKCYLENNHFGDMNRIDGMPTENIHRNHSVGPPPEDSKSNDRLAE